MKVMLCCSTSSYDKVDEICKYLKENNFEVIYPNGYLEDDFELSENATEEEYSKFFKKMFQKSIDKIKECDAILVLNYDKIKKGVVFQNYIGASTFLEMYEAFMNNKKIYMINNYPDNLLLDEIKSFRPVILNGDIKNFK